MAKRIRLTVETGFAGCVHEDFQDLPDNWDEMTEEERQEHLDAEAEMFLQNHISYGASVVDDDEE